jgi:SulP family sulfate permease
VVLFYLSGPMIFGIAKAIAREQSAMRDSDVLILDLSDVPMLGVTVSLSLENVIEEALSAGRRVLVVSATDEVRDRLDRLDIVREADAVQFAVTRLEALGIAADWITPPRQTDQP